MDRRMAPPGPQDRHFPANAGFSSPNQDPRTRSVNSLLCDPLITARVADGGRESLSLPELFAALSADRVVDFPALRPHQRHAWHAFLAQLATMALENRGLPAGPETPAEWADALRMLTPQFPNDEPWRLVVEDAALPAFLQCPCANGLADYRKEIFAPDVLDLLVTAKNHDVKQNIATSNAPEDWLFALVDLQTMAGVLGAGNYGIARMNGGYSARPCVGLAPADGGIGAHWLHDVRRMRTERTSVLERLAPYFRPQGGIALLWLEPWDGTESVDLRALDPYFIEICRRIRLQRHGGSVRARAAASKKPRVAAKSAKGNLGDFWTPIEIKEGKALSVSASGFTYKRLATLLFDQARYEKPAAMRVDGSASQRWTLVARGVAGGQGKTEGYHERTDIAFSRRVARAFGRRKESDRLAEIAQAQIEEIAGVTSALRFGIATAASGGKAPEDLGKGDRAAAEPYVKRLDQVADARFFSYLEARFLAGDADALAVQRASFASELIEVARCLLGEAVETVPCPAIRRHRARAKAFSAFNRDLFKSKGVFAEERELLTAKGGSNG